MQILFKKSIEQIGGFSVEGSAETLIDYANRQLSFLANEASADQFRDFFSSDQSQNFLEIIFTEEVSGDLAVFFWRSALLCERSFWVDMTTLSKEGKSLLQIAVERELCAVLRSLLENSPAEYQDSLWHEVQEALLPDPDAYFDILDHESKWALVSELLQLCPKGYLDVFLIKTFSLFGPSLENPQSLADVFARYTPEEVLERCVHVADFFAKSECQEGFNNYLGIICSYCEGNNIWQNRALEKALTQLLSTHSQFTESFIEKEKGFNQLSPTLQLLFLPFQPPPLIITAINQRLYLLDSVLKQEISFPATVVFQEGDTVVPCDKIALERVLGLIYELLQKRDLSESESNALIFFKKILLDLPAIDLAVLFAGVEKLQEVDFLPLIDMGHAQRALIVPILDVKILISRIAHCSSEELYSLLSYATAIQKMGFFLRWHKENSLFEHDNRVLLERKKCEIVALQAILAGMSPKVRDNLVQMHQAIEKLILGFGVEEAI